MAQISPSVPEGVNEKAGILRIATEEIKPIRGILAGCCASARSNETRRIAVIAKRALDSWPRG